MLLLILRTTLGAKVILPILEMRDLEINKVRHKKGQKPEQAHITAKW